MEYIKREAERKFREMSNFFKVVLVTGARQVGKTTMLKKLADGTDRTYVSLDDIMARELAQSDPALFFQKYKPPVIIDEVQYAPQLFEHIKVICDSSEEYGQFWLTGSQQYDMMKHVRETLAGRIGILSLYSLSQREKSGITFDEPLDFHLKSFAKGRTKQIRTIFQTYSNIYGVAVCPVFNRLTKKCGRSISTRMLIPTSCVMLLRQAE